MIQAVSDFVFDLHDSTRRSLSAADTALLYDVKFRELSERHFSSNPWPEASVIAPDCNHDEPFLLLYKEMILRARSMASGSFKFQAADFVDSWTTYSQLFDFIRSVEDNELMLTPQWVYDIVQEYVYQFQGFCQYRSSSREPAVVLANKQAWAVATVHRTLTDLIALFAPQATTTKSHFGYFAMIELSRLECLLGDFSASISSVSSVRIFDRTELFNTVLSSHVNMYYHACVSLLMLRRFADSIQVLSEALLHISRVLRPGAGALRQPSQSVLQKMMDKVLALLAISMALSPGTRVDDQVRELVEQRVQDKYRRMQTGDVSAFEEAFEAACPKFISPCVPTVYPTANLCHETVRMVVSVFMSEVRQHAALLKLRSYMRLYSAVQVDKLARLNDSTEAELLSQLVAYKHKHSEAAASTTAGESVEVPGAAASADVHYYIDGGALHIEEAAGSSDKTRAAERHFISGIRKHAEVAAGLTRSAWKYGL